MCKSVLLPLQLFFFYLPSSSPIVRSDFRMRGMRGDTLMTSSICFAGRGGARVLCCTAVNGWRGVVDHRAVLF